MIAVADALAYAHSESVIHRDLKPANILVGAYGETIVIDWGLAKNLATGEEIDELPLGTTIPPEGAGDLTIAGSVLGTPAYMPPEQAHGDPLDEHADVYAIGAILYHVLSGTRPYAEAVTFEDLMIAVTSRPPRPLGELAPAVPRELIAIVEKAMARAAADRYPTADGLAQDLRRYQAGKLVGAHHYTNAQLLRRWIAQHRAIVLTAAIATIALAMVLTTSIWRISAERDEAQAQRELARAEKTDAQAARRARRAALRGLPRGARAPGAARGRRRSHAHVDGRLDAPRARCATPTLGMLGAEARAPYAGLLAITPPQPSGTTNVQISDDGMRLFEVASSSHGEARDVAHQRVAWTATARRRRRAVAGWALARSA